MADFKTKIQKIIDEGFTKEQIRPDLNTIKQGYYKAYIAQPEKKETFDINISMKGLKDRIQSKDQGGTDNKYDNTKAKVKSTNSNYYPSSQASTIQYTNNEIEIKEIPTKYGKRHSTQTKQHLYKDIIASLDVNKVRNCYKSKVKRDIEAFSNTMKKATITTTNSVKNKQPLPSIPNIPQQDNNNNKGINMKASISCHQSFYLINHKINSILNKTNSLMNPANKSIFKSNNNNNKSRSTKWTKVTSINLDNTRNDVDDFSKSFDLQMSSLQKGKEVNKRNTLFEHYRKQSEKNIREKLLLDF